MQIESMFRSSFILRWVGVIALVASTVGAWSQDDLLLVSGTLTDDGNRKKMPGVEVVVYQDGVEFDRMTTDARASYAFELPLRHDYVFSYEFEGYGNKRIQVDASGVPAEDLKGGFNLDLDMSMFALVEGFDETILEDPFGKASFDAQRNTLSFDFDYTDRMKTRVENEFDRVERMAELLAQMKEDFAELMEEGQQALDKSKWQNALAAFTQALELFPDDASALAKQSEAQAAVDAAAAADRLEADFQAALEEGESFLKSDKLDRAREAFESAAAMKPTAPEPAQGLARVADRAAALGAAAEYDGKVASADKAFNEERWADAKALYEAASAMQPSERYPKEQITACQSRLDAQADAAAALAARAVEYEAFIEAGDQFFRSGNWAEALAQYEAAAALLPAESYPQDRAAKCRDKLTDEAADAEAAARAAADAAASAELEATYDAAIAQGDVAYDAGNWEAAQSAYQSALEVKPGERYPLSRLDKISREIQREEAALADAAAAERDAAAAAEREAEREAEAAARAAEREAEAAARAAAKDAAAAAAKAEREERARAEAEAEAAAEAERRARAAAAAAAAAAAEAEQQAMEAAAAEAAAQAQAEREARAAAQAAADAEAEAKRRAAQEAARKRAQEVAAAMDVDDDDEAEAYYRAALESERRAKAMEVEAEKERAAALQSEAQERSQRLRASAKDDVDELAAETVELLNERAGRRADEVAELAEEKDRIERQQREMSERGTAMSRGEALDAAGQEAAMRDLVADRRDDYREEMPAIATEHAQRQSNHADWNAAATDQRNAAFTTTQYVADQYAALGEGEMERLRATQAEINASATGFAEDEQNRALQAEGRRYDARQEVLALDQGAPTRAEEYTLAPEDVDVAPGIQEQSYDIPNGLVIERTVRVGNHVRRFRKVVTKTGVYYFEGEDSITESAWRRETTVILD